MSEAFLKVVNMSISAGWLALAVLVLRLILKKAPKWVNVLLWGIVAIRLICPFSIESTLSLIPSTETISPEIMMDWTPEISTGIEPLDQVVNPVISTSFAPNPGASANPLQILIPVAANLWLFCVLLLLAYTAISYLTLRYKLRTAVILRGNIFQCETVSSPFVLGILKPRIYLPYAMDGKNLGHVVAHEQAHIKRKDHWWKPLGFLLLTVYWFNPLMWVAYILLCRDIELACDEKVIAELGNEQRADYTQALVACAVNRRMIAVCPLAFGEVGVKERVKSVMNYKKPTYWIAVASVLSCVIFAVCFLTNPVDFTVYEIFAEDGYSVIKQDEIDITLYIDKSKLPDDIYTTAGHEFKPDEITVFSTVTSKIYLHKAMLSNESDDLLYLMFDCSYDLPKSGSIVSPYRYTGEHDGMQSNLYLRSEDVRDENTTYPGALDIRSHGPGNQFAFYISREACMAANGTLAIDVVCNQIVYAKEGHGFDSRQGSSESAPDKVTFEAEVVEVHDGFFLVAPEAGWALNSVDRIEVPMMNMDPALEPQLGDIIEITYDGVILETNPARLSKVYSIKVTKESTRLSLNSELAFEFNFAGNTSGSQRMELTEDKPYWCITVVNEGTNGINIDILGTIYMVDAGTTGHIYPDKAWNPGTYSVFFGTAGGIGMEGHAICSISSVPFQAEEPLARKISSAERLPDHPLVAYISSEWAIDSSGEDVELPFKHLDIRADGSGTIDGVGVTWEICEEYTSKQSLHIELWDDYEYVGSVVYWRDSQLLQIIDQNDNLVESYYHRIAYATG